MVYIEQRVVLSPDTRERIDVMLAQLETFNQAFTNLTRYVSSILESYDPAIIEPFSRHGESVIKHIGSATQHIGNLRGQIEAFNNHVDALILRLDTFLWQLNHFNVNFERVVTLVIVVVLFWCVVVFLAGWRILRCFKRDATVPARR